MSNILVIKHGSLGDIVQISGALRDIRESFRNDKIFILTTSPYVELLSRCPFVDGVLIDKRLPRWNFLYLLKLSQMIKKFNFLYAFDLQNSSRTNFYKKFLFKIPSWNSSLTALEKGEKKSDFDNEPVLDRFKSQLDKSDVKVNYTLTPDFSWACVNIDSIINKFFSKKFIIVFPFSSPQLPQKQWPHYNELINIIKYKHPNLEIVTAPGPNEIDESNKIDAVTITNNQNSLNIMELAGLIKKSILIIGNDTGPVHMAAHLKKSGVVLFGHHTTPKKVSIETENFKALVVEKLEKLTPDLVYIEVKKKLEKLGIN